VALATVVQEMVEMVAVEVDSPLVVQTLVAVLVKFIFVVSA
jgi:hypothetical protein